MTRARSRSVLALCALTALLSGPARPEAAGSAGPRTNDAVREILSLAGDPVAGAASYRACAACHGADGSGRSDGTFPRLAGQHRSVIVKQLVDIQEGRRSNPVMEHFAETLIDGREIADLAAYVETLPRPPENGTGDGRALEEGRRTYGRDCSDCHGERGEGDAERFTPVLAGQHYAYLLRQARAIAAGRRGNAHAAMRRRVADYSDAQLQAVIDYASRLPGLRRSAAPADGTP